jgi:hypothetical protein
LLGLEPQIFDRLVSAAGASGERAGVAELHSSRSRDSVQVSGAAGHAPQNIISWLKAGQICLLCEAGASAELEGVCRRPGVELRGVGPNGNVLLEAVVKTVSAGGQKGAAGLLLHACKDVTGALTEWQDAFEAGRAASACSVASSRRVSGAHAQRHDVNPALLVPTPAAVHKALNTPEMHRAASTAAWGSEGAGQRNGRGRHRLAQKANNSAYFEDIGECRSVEEHVVAAAAAAGESGLGYAAAARALVCAARAAEVFCDPEKVAELTDSHISWLLQMPSQCALGVLCARRDLQPEDLFSVCHELNGNEEGGMLDAVQLWLQVRFRAGARILGWQQSSVSRPLPAALWQRFLRYRASRMQSSRLSVPIRKSMRTCSTYWHCFALPQALNVSKVAAGAHAEGPGLPRSRARPPSRDESLSDHPIGLQDVSNLQLLRTPAHPITPVVWLPDPCDPRMSDRRALANP